MTQLQYQSGAQSSGALSGSERVTIDNGGSVEVVCTTSQIAALYKPIAAVPTLIAAAGATQGNATAIGVGQQNVIITSATTNSSKGVRLPVGTTGIEYSIANAGSHGVKIYPATGCKIATNNTNVADSTLLTMKQNKYRAASKTLWVAERGA